MQTWMTRHCVRGLPLFDGSGSVNWNSACSVYMRVLLTLHCHNQMGVDMKKAKRGTDPYVLIGTDPYVM